MKTRHLLSGIIMVMLLQGAATHAQSQWHLTFRSTCRTTNDFGRFFTSVLTERHIVRQCALDHGITNIRHLALVYSLGAEFNGDAIQVVNRTNGNVLCTPFRLLFKRGIATGDQNRAEKVCFLYNGQNTDAIGSVYLTESTHFRNDGSTNRVLVSGRFYYLDEVYFSNRLAVCSGAFTTGKPLVLPEP